MSFMELYVYPKGALYFADCARCGATIYTHEWTAPDFNAERDAMQAGTLSCPHCGIGRADPATFGKAKRPHYAARYSADGYMDCTDWNFGSNRRELVRETRAMYGEE